MHGADGETSLPALQKSNLKNEPRGPEVGLQTVDQYETVSSDHLSLALSRMQQMFHLNTEKNTLKPVHKTDLCILKCKQVSTVKSSKQLPDSNAC